MLSFITTFGYLVWIPIKTNYHATQTLRNNFCWSQALDEKYDALRDKLLLEALMAQMSEAEWKKLSEEERQRLLMELRLKEKRLRQQGGHIQYGSFMYSLFLSTSWLKLS